MRKFKLWLSHNTGNYDLQKHVFFFFFIWAFILSCELSQKSCNGMFLIFSILVEIVMAKWDPFFHPINFIACSTQSRFAQEFTHNLNRTPHLSTKYTWLTRCTFHKAAATVTSAWERFKSVKNLEMKDLSTNHSCIYIDNRTQEQYLRSNTYNNKINQCDIARER